MNSTSVHVGDRCSSFCVAQKDGTDDCDRSVEHDVNYQESKVAIPVVVRDSKRSVEFVANFDRTVLAIIRGSWIDEISSRSVHEWSGPLFASLTCRRRETEELRFSAGDFQTVKFVRYQSTDQICQRIDMIEPLPPELGNLRWRNCHTTEQGRDDQDERICHCRNEDGWRQSSDSLTNRDSEEFNDKNDEERVSGPVAGIVETGGVIEGQEESHSTQDAAGYFCNKLSDGEDRGRVHFGTGFSNEHLACHDEHGLNLRDDNGRQDGDDENGEDTVLQVGVTISHLQERETSQEGNDNVSEETSEDIVWRSPHSLIGSFDHDF